MSPSNTRWCPTPEQLMILEELYRRGLKTPNANQIQRITGHLSMHGKIQGKNVFYWFQNHKARDRQKLRKKLAKQLLQSQQQFSYFPHHYFPLNFRHAQQATSNGGACDEMGPWPEIISWRAADLVPKGCFIVPPTSYGYEHHHDYTMTTDAGSASSCYTGNNNSSNTGTTKPLRTLELFPLRSTKDDYKDFTLS